MDDVREFEEEFEDDDDEDWGDWRNSEVLKISDSNELYLELKKEFQEEMAQGDAKQTVLMIENVNKLVLDFIMNDISDGRVSIKIATFFILDNLVFSIIHNHHIITRSKSFY